MGWLSRIRGSREEARASTDDAAEPPTSLVRASPGLGVLFDGMRREGGHSILDLGEGSNKQMEVLAPYARIIRFVGLVPGGDGASERRMDPATLPVHPEYPYDIVLGWGALDALIPPEREVLMERLTEITAPGARMYAWVSSGEADEVRHVRSTILDKGRVEEEFVGPVRTAGAPLLPAQLERLLAPWVVSHAFSLRVGKREYVVRKGAEGR